MYAATIRGNLSCAGGEFRNPDGVALNAQGASIGGSILLGTIARNGEPDKPSRAEGTVHLLNARVGQDLVCDGEMLINKKGVALNAEGADVTGSVLLSVRFLDEGAVRLTSLRVRGALRIVNIASANKITELNLRFAAVSTFDHAVNSWPERERLLVNGFVYGALGESFQKDSKSYVEWVRLQQKEIFSLQPYEQLAKALKTSGDERLATEVLIAKQDDLREHGGLTKWGKRWNRCLGITIKHGYKPHRALVGMLFFVFLGTVFFQVGYWNHLITPSNDIKNEQRAKVNYPKFQAFVYSLDTFVPIVDLKQKGYWLPNPNLGDNIIPTVRFRWGGLLRIYFWIHIIFGWVLTTLWAAGFTGFVRRLN